MPHQADAFGGVLPRISEVSGHGRSFGTRLGGAVVDVLDPIGLVHEGGLLAGGGGLLGGALGGGDVSQFGDPARKQLLARIMALLSGKGPSVAEEQLRAGLGQAQAGAQARAASARGGPLEQLLAQRFGQQTQAQLGREAAVEGGQLRAREQFAALEALQRLREGDIGAFGAQTGAESAQRQAEAQRFGALASLGGTLAGLG